jgi:hypothetical protein
MGTDEASVPIAHHCGKARRGRCAVLYKELSETFLFRQVDGAHSGQAKRRSPSCLALPLISKSSSIAQLVGFEAIAGVGYGSVLNIGSSRSLAHDRSATCNEHAMYTVRDELTFPVVLLVQADYLKTPHLVPHVTNVLNVSRSGSGTWTSSWYPTGLLADLPVLGLCRSHRRHVHRHQHLRKQGE